MSAYRITLTRRQFNDEGRALACALAFGADGAAVRKNDVLRDVETVADAPSCHGCGKYGQFV